MIIDFLPKIHKYQQVQLTINESINDIKNEINISKNENVILKRCY